MNRKLRFESFEELENLVSQLIGRDYVIHWDSDDPEDYTGWIEVFE